jgi:hypothetical protein
MGKRPPHTFRHSRAPSRISSPPLAPTFGWLLNLLFKWRPSKAKVPLPSLFSMGRISAPLAAPTARNKTNHFPGVGNNLRRTRIASERAADSDGWQKRWRQTRRHVRKNSHQRARVKKSIRSHHPPGKNTKTSAPEAGHDVARTRVASEPAVDCHGRR